MIAYAVDAGAAPESCSAVWVAGAGSAAFSFKFNAAMPSDALVASSIWMAVQ